MRVVTKDTNKTDNWIMDHCEDCDTPLRDERGIAFREGGSYDMPPFVVCEKCLRGALSALGRAKCPDLGVSNWKLLERMRAMPRQWYYSLSKWQESIDAELVAGGYLEKKVLGWGSIQCAYRLSQREVNEQTKPSRGDDKIWVEIDLFFRDMQDKPDIWFELPKEDWEDIIDQALVIPGIVIKRVGPGREVAYRLNVRRKSDEVG